jgi:threonine synthase
MTHPKASYLAPVSGETYPLDVPRWCGPGKAPLMLTELPGISASDIDQTTNSIWRYRAAFPVEIDQPITLGEGMTPLLPKRIGGIDTLVKCEWVMPTGSFKDRGASVMLSILRQQGISQVLEDSSGNGGAAISAYAAAGGMQATIMAPLSTSPAKTVQMRAQGAEVELIPGTRQDTSLAAEARSTEIFYASHNWHPFFLHGTKTLAYELWEQLGFRAPDNVVIPCGAGSNILGCDIGFGELLRAGMIHKLPRLFAAQPAQCGPIARNMLGLAPAPFGKTIAEGTAIAAPIRMREVIAALRRSGGSAVLLSEREIAEATFTLAGMGLYVEPTCAQAAAALAHLVQGGLVRPGEITVLVLTGSGLKATPLIAELMGLTL